MRARQPQLFYILALTIPMSFGFSGTAASQVLDNLDSLNVQAAIDVGLRMHPDLAGFDAERMIVDGLRTQQSPFESPTVAFEREGIERSDFSEQRFVVGQVVTSPLASAFARRKYQRMADAVGLLRETRERMIKSAIQRAFVDYVHTRALNDVRKEEVEIAEALLRMSENRERAGEVSHLEVLRARIEVVEAQAALAESSRQLELERMGVYRATGVESIAGLPPIQARRMLPEHLIAVDSTQIFSQIAEAPELRAADQAIEAARNGVREARSGVMPDLTVEVFPQDLGDGFTAWGYQVGLRLHLPFSAALRGRRQEARGVLLREQSAARETKLGVATEADSVWARYRSAQTTLRLLESQGVEESRELLRLTMRGYELGELPLVSVLDVRRSVLRMQQRHLTALREYYHQVIDLERISGQDLMSPVL